MTYGEEQALLVANQYKGDISTDAKLKWLAGEVVELSIAIANGDKKNVIEEIGDCAFLLSHILQRYDDDDLGIITTIVKASLKMERRNERT